MGEPQERVSKWIGRVLHDKWRIDGRIARGGVATVYRATHRQGQVAAIKIMHPEYARNEEVRRRFLREGYAANKVGHRGVVRVLDDDVTEDGHAYIVMELLHKGEVLEDRRERLGGRLPAHDAVDICHQILDVLAAAHENGIIHRDIKPENIFVLDDGVVKVLDFGIAHIREEAAKHEPTATGLLLGTPDYMSPEQALGKRGHIDAQTDVYAVGAMMFTLLSGEAVHITDTLTALLVAAASRQARSLASTVFKDIPRELIAVVDKAVMLEKPRRWPSARAMQEALRAAVPGAVTTRALSATGANASLGAGAGTSAISNANVSPNTTAITKPNASVSASASPITSANPSVPPSIDPPTQRAVADPIDDAAPSFPTVVNVTNIKPPSDSVPPASSPTAAYVMPPRAIPARVSAPPPGPAPPPPPPGAAAPPPAPAPPPRRASDRFDQPIDEDDDLPTKTGLNPAKILAAAKAMPVLEPWTDETSALEDGPTVATGSVPALRPSLEKAKAEKPQLPAHHDDGEATRPVTREELVARPPRTKPSSSPAFPTKSSSSVLPMKPSVPIVPTKPSIPTTPPKPAPSTMGKTTAKLDIPPPPVGATAPRATASHGSIPAPPPRPAPSFAPPALYPSQAPSMPPLQQGHPSHPPPGHSMTPPWNPQPFSSAPQPMLQKALPKAGEPSPLAIAAMAFAAFLVISLSLGSCLWLRSH